MRPIRPYAIAAVALSWLAVYALPAQAACKRFGFLVNDYGKEGPTKDAKELLDKHIKKWTAEQGITKFQISNKQVTCELFLDVGLFDEYTCTAKASVCWDGDQAKTKTKAKTAVNDDAVTDNEEEDFEVPPTPVRKAALAPETGAPSAAAKDSTPEEAVKTAEQAAEEAEAAAKAAVAEAETAAKEAEVASKGSSTNTEEDATSTGDDETAADEAPSSETDTAKAKPAEAANVIVETGALPANAKAAAAQVAKTSPAMGNQASRANKKKAAAEASERAAAAEAAAAAAERAAKAAEQAAAAAKAAAAAAIAASEASQGGTVVPALQ